MSQEDTVNKIYENLVSHFVSQKVEYIKIGSKKNKYEMWFKQLVISL